MYEFFRQHLLYPSHFHGIQFNGLPALPNDLVFTASGDAYVADSFQATIWRIPAGGGAPQIWFQDPRFASAYIGVNGIRLDPARTRLYVSVSIDLLTRGRIYSLPLIAKPDPADLTLFHAFAPSLREELLGVLGRFAAEFAPPAARIEGLMDLGGGTALAIRSPGMLAIRAAIADHFHGALTAQDQGTPWLHITIQNKVQCASKSTNM